MMLLQKDCAHLKAADWSNIFQRIMRLEKGEKFLMTVSDEHEGGVTSCMPQMKPVLDGAAAGASILVLNGDDFEYESPALFVSQMPERKLRLQHLGRREYHDAMVKEASDALYVKVQEDLDTLEKIITADPNRRVFKVIGNHENFETFRNGLTELEKKHKNFQWSPEAALIPMPGGKKETRDRLLAVHGDLQMDDLWFVEEGGTDKERKLLKHHEMAEKVVRTATKSWAPSAEKQEKGQSIVNWWRKPNATAKALYAELAYRAQEGDFHTAAKKNELNLDTLTATESKLKKRIKKYEEFLDELEKSKEDGPHERAQKREVYERAIMRTQGKLDRLEEVHGRLVSKSHALMPSFSASTRRLYHTKKIGSEKEEKPEPEVLTSKALSRITHINYGHTHVSEEGVEINGVDGKPIKVSNNASVTGAIIRRPLDTGGKPLAGIGKGKDEPDLGNLGALLYRVNEDGKITEIMSVGRLIRENLKQVQAMISKVPKMAVQQEPEGERRSAIDPAAIAQKKAAGGGPGTPPTS